MSRVNAWTQWGTLQEIVVGRVPEDACFPPVEPNFHPDINDPEQAKKGWPSGRKPKAVVDAANSELDHLCDLLAEECVRVSRTNKLNAQMGRHTDILETTACSPSTAGALRKPACRVLRPEMHACHSPVRTPAWSLDYLSGNGCPRDVMITIGNILLEATMSKRSRSFEWMQYRGIVNSWRERDPRMLHKAAPTPLLVDSSYDESFWTLSDVERLKRQHTYNFVINENEVMFDAADITRVGKDVFVSKSMVTNNAGISWLRRELEPHGVRVNSLHFPFDLKPSHIDCTFVPLRPPKGLHGEEGLALFNPDRPPLEAEMALWHNNNWRLVAAPEPAHDDLPCYSQSSRWLSMNLLSLSERCVVIEDNELPMHRLLTDLGFDVITTPFRHFYEFGGSLHCSTWDTCRDDGCVDYFPDQSEAYHGAERWEAFQARWDVTRTMSAQDPLHPYAAPRHPHEPTSASRAAEDAARADLREAKRPRREAWEQPYLRRLATEACRFGGNVLQTGGGLDAAGVRVLEHAGKVLEHHVVEGDEAAYKALSAQADDINAKSDGSPKIVCHFGRWQDLYSKLLAELGEGFFSSLLYVSRPQNGSDNGRGTAHLHQFEFAKTYFPLLREGGSFVYFSSVEAPEVADLEFDKWHRPHLKSIGFQHIRYPIKFLHSEFFDEAAGECVALVPCITKCSSEPADPEWVVQLKTNERTRAAQTRS